MKQNKVIRLTITAIILALACTIGVTAAFKDVADSPYKEAIEELANLKITVGKSNAEFGGDENVTRQQMTLFFARLLTGNEINGSEKTTNDTPFTDITDPTYFKSTLYCYENKIIEGRSETIFDPTGNVAVQEAITMAVRALGYTDLAYPDGYIQIADDFGMLTKLENVSYTAPMTREQVAQLIYNTLHNINFVGGYGKSLYDVNFSEVKKLGYFEIKNYDELRANYTSRHAKFNLQDGYDSYIVEDVTVMGYTGDLQYYFGRADGAHVGECDIIFRFTIMGEYKVLNPENIWIENPSNELTAAEAKALLEPMNLRMARYAGRSYTAYSTIGTKDGAPADIYKAAVDGYTRLYVGYQEKENNKYLPQSWRLTIKTDSSKLGCILEGMIEYSRWGLKD